VALLAPDPRRIADPPAQAPADDRVADAVADGTPDSLRADLVALLGERTTIDTAAPDAEERFAAAEPARDEAAEIAGRSFDAYLSSNRTCELGLQQATSRPYRSVVQALEEQTR
jgi:hypothetical protein